MPGGQGGGSGVVISADGYALTNFHVVHPCGNAMKCGMSDGRVYDAVIVGLDPTGDVALIKLLGRDDFPHAELGDSDRLRAGDWVFAMGNPFLLATDFQPTVTSGIISGVHRYQFPDGTLLEYADCLQTDASINPGNSGGPLFNGQAQVVGINGRCSFDKRGRVSVDVGYAVSINQIKNFLGVLRSGRIVDHATLGARVTADDAGPRASGRYSGIVRRLPPRAADRRRNHQLRRPADLHAQRFQERAGHLPQGMARAADLSPREPDLRRSMSALTGVHGREQLIEKTLGRPAQPMPLPKPGRATGTPGRGRKGLPKLPQIPKMEPQKAPMPEVVKKVFEEKHGYANYFFNKLEQERVLKLWKPPGDAKGSRGVWTFVGRLQSGKEVRFRIADNEVELKAPAGDSKWKLGPKFAEAFQPGSTSGLLPAMFLYRLMALDGPKGFTARFITWARCRCRGKRACSTCCCRVSRRGELVLLRPAAAGWPPWRSMPDEHSDPWEIHFSQLSRRRRPRSAGPLVKSYGNGSVCDVRLDEFRFRRGGEVSDDPDCRLQSDSDARPRAGGSPNKRATLQIMR